MFEQKNYYDTPTNIISYYILNFSSFIGLNGCRLICTEILFSDTKKMLGISSYNIRLNFVMCELTCDLNGSVRGRVSSSRKRFWTLPNLYSEVSETKILLFSYWFFMQIGWRETLDTSEP